MWDVDAGADPTMTRCPECDWELDPSDELCPNCGAILADYEDAEELEE